MADNKIDPIIIKKIDKIINGQAPDRETLENFISQYHNKHTPKTNPIGEAVSNTLEATSAVTDFWVALAPAINILKAIPVIGGIVGLLSEFAEIYRERKEQLKNRYSTMSKVGRIGLIVTGILAATATLVLAAVPGVALVYIAIPFLVSAVTNLAKAIQRSRHESQQAKNDEKELATLKKQIARKKKDRVIITDEDRLKFAELQLKVLGHAAESKKTTKKALATMHKVGAGLVVLGTIMLFTPLAPFGAGIIATGVATSFLATAGGWVSRFFEKRNARTNKETKQETQTHAEESEQHEKQKGVSVADDISISLSPNNTTETRGQEAPHTIDNGPTSDDVTTAPISSDAKIAQELKAFSTEQTTIIKNDLKEIRHKAFEQIELNEQTNPAALGPHLNLLTELLDSARKERNSPPTPPANTPEELRESWKKALKENYEEHINRISERYDEAEELKKRLEERETTEEDQEGEGEGEIEDPGLGKHRS